MAAIPVNSSFTFTRYDVTDSGVVMWFVCLLPGSGNDTDYSVLLTQAELDGVANAAQLRTLVTAKLARRIRAATIAIRLDSFVGQSVTI